MTNIEWTDQTWNPATGCTRVSPGCDNCYMYATYPRLRAMGARGYETSPDDVRELPERLEEPLKWRKPRMVFVGSMTDVFHPRISRDYLIDMFRVMRQAAGERGHVFQLLTKRIGRALAFYRYLAEPAGDAFEWHPNIWIGTSVEDQERASRLDYLAKIPAPVRFVSAEPLIGPLDLTPWLQRYAIQWLIVGGESGPPARPMNLDWARSLRDQAAAHDVPFFLKQLGGRGDKRGKDAALLDGRLHRAMPRRTQARL